MSLIWPAQPMRDADIFVTDFAEYSTGAQPPDWTSHLGSGFTAQVQSVAGSMSGKALRWTKTSSARQILSWDKVPNNADIEQVMRFRSIEAWANNESVIGLCCRATGSAGAETHYHSSGFSNTSAPFLSSQIQKVVSGSFTNLASNIFVTGGNVVINGWVWMRFRVNGATLSRSCWLDGAAEPGSWQESFTDISIAGGGWHGFRQSFANPDCEIDFYSVALKGKIAPKVRR